MDCAHLIRPTAHRGLHAVKRGIIENTAPAFEAAIQNCYGIECDLQPISGGEPIVFHDDKLDRLIDGKGPVAALNQRELKTLRFKSATDHDVRILLFRELLELVDGRVPLLVEIKSDWSPPNNTFLKKIAKQTQLYRGAIGLMSFDPAVMTALRSFAPGVPRGLVSGRYQGAGWWQPKISRARSVQLRNLLESGPVAPSFYAYEVSELPTPITDYVRLVHGLPLFTWTVRTPRDRARALKHADAMIFEGIEP